MVHVRTDDVSASDEAILIARAVQKDETAIRAIITQHNRRLYRVARSVLKNDSEAVREFAEVWNRCPQSESAPMRDSGISQLCERILARGKP